MRKSIPKMGGPNMNIEYTEIYREKTDDYEQIISVDETNLLFKIETIYDARFNMGKKISFIDKYEAKAIGEHLRKCGAWG